jgi:pimeloyl-ACP methyl ester carboxylesterase
MRTLVPADAVRRDFVMDDGVRLTGDALVGRRAPQVLLLHGGGQTRHAWAATARSLNAAGWGTTCVDLRGHGDSGWSPDGDYSLDRFAADVAALLCTFADPPAIIGASLGGLSSLLALSRQEHPHAIGLVLVDVAHRFEPAGGQRILDFMRRRPHGFDDPGQAAEQVASYLPHRARRLQETGLLKNLRLREGRWRWHWDPALLKTSRPLTDPGLRAAYTERLRSGIASLAMPILLVRGALSDVVTPEIAAEFQTLSPLAQVVEVPGAAHMVAGDSNARFTAAVSAFLKGM